MRRILIGILLLLIFAFSDAALAAHAFVACSGTCTNSNTSTTSLTLPASGTLTFTAHNLLWVSIRAGHNITINTPTSSPTETWTCRPTFDPGVGLTSMTACYAWNIAGGSYTITVTTGSTANLHLAVDEYSGTPTTCDPVQGSQVNTNNSGATSITSNSITTTGTTSLLVSTGIGSNASGWTQGSNMTQRASISVSGRIGTEDRLNVAANSYTPSQSYTSSNTDGTMIVTAIIQVCSKPANQFPRVY